jgi:SAM-dependent methyltransferase
MPLHAAAIFLGSFLLFLVQPLVARQMLPWFGGAASVWTVCMVFFQVALLAGYAYAHLVTRYLAPKPRAVLHLALLTLSLLWLPITADASWKPAGGDAPAPRILLFLLATIGLPFTLLAANGPLAQAWFTRARPDVSPYRLFALSNFASLLALLGYPVLLEPWLATAGQVWVWSSLYMVFTIVLAITAFIDSRLPASPATQASDTADASPPSTRDYLVWTGLAALGSVLLLAVTNHLTQDVASFPLLWVVPLALYLVTFILCFERERVYRLPLYAILFIAVVVCFAVARGVPGLKDNLPAQLAVSAALVFVGCMICHGELAQMRPAPRHLTGFYLTVAAGGALGGLLVGVAAPLLLPNYFELDIALAALVGLILLRIRAGKPGSPVFTAIALGGPLLLVGAQFIKERAESVASIRNFYGVLRLLEVGEGIERERQIVHGAIIHGRQFLNAERRREAAGYYRREGGGGRAIEAQMERGPVRVGVVGLGAGALAAYGRAGDTIRFYEINPAVIAMAQQDFSYLGDSKARIETVLGDARLVLEREPPQRFDVLAIDAFSGDAIPVHLLTLEALDVYLRHLASDGILAFHVSNKFLVLPPVVGALAKARGLQARYVGDRDPASGAAVSEWVLLSRNAQSLALPRIATASTEAPVRGPAWTDDFATPLLALKW